MKNSLEEIQFVSRFSEEQWQRLCNHNGRWLRISMNQGREEAEAFAIGVLGELPEIKRMAVVLPFAMA